MKKYSLLIMVCIIIFLSACSKSEKEKIYAVDIKNAETFEYQKSEKLAEKIKMNHYVIELPKGGCAGPFCIYGTTLYYSIDYIDYLSDQTGEEKVPLFEEKYNTQIRSFDLESQEGQLIYQYKKERCIQISYMFCTGKKLVWSDNDLETINEKWSINEIELDSGLVSENVYYSDESPIEKMRIMNNICTTYQMNGDNTVIYMENIKTEETVGISVESEVSVPLCNGEICIWASGYEAQDRNIIYIYDISQQTIEKLEVTNAFSYALVKDLILVKQEEGICCYDIKSKEYINLIPKEEAECGYTMQGLENNSYAKKYWNDEKLDFFHFSYCK